MPMWSLAVLAVLFVGPVAAFEPVFGGGVGRYRRRRWRRVRPRDRFRVDQVALGRDHHDDGPGRPGHILPAGQRRRPALRAASLAFCPPARPSRSMVLGSFRAWKDLLTLTAPVSAYSGPALVPWMCGLLFASAAGLITARAGSRPPGLRSGHRDGRDRPVLRPVRPAAARVVDPDLVGRSGCLVGRGRPVSAHHAGPGRARGPFRDARHREHTRGAAPAPPSTWARASSALSSCSRSPWASPCPPPPSWGAARARASSAATWSSRPWTFRPTPRPWPRSATTRRT